MIVMISGMIKTNFLLQLIKIEPLKFYIRHINKFLSM